MKIVADLKLASLVRKYHLPVCWVKYDGSMDEKRNERDLPKSWSGVWMEYNLWNSVRWGSPGNEMFMSKVVG